MQNKTNVQIEIKQSLLLLMKNKNLYYKNLRWINKQMKAGEKITEGEGDRHFKNVFIFF